MKLFRRALLFSLAPLALGLVQLGMDVYNGESQFLERLVTLAVATLIFAAWLILGSFLLGQFVNPRFLLRLRVNCPQCGHQQPIINTRCFACHAAIGFPVESRPTAILCLVGLIIFEVALAYLPNMI